MVEAVNLIDFGFIRHLVYNMARMFAFSGSYFSVISYGTSIYRVCNFVQFRTASECKAMTLKIPKGASGQVNNRKISITIIRLGWGTVLTERLAPCAMQTVFFLFLSELLLFPLNLLLQPIVDFYTSD